MIFLPASTINELDDIAYENNFINLISNMEFFNKYNVFDVND